MNLAHIRIRATAHEPQLAAALADVLIDCVEAGAKPAGPCWCWTLSPAAVTSVVTPACAGTGCV
jgi:hypothetical protein